VGDFSRWELVEYTLPTPTDWHTVTEVLERLRAELPDRTRFADAVQVLTGDGEIIFRYRKART
jgi:hypothetical protein